MICPDNTRRQSDVGAGYASLAEQLLKFNEFNALPSYLDLKRINVGHRLCEALVQHNGKWHKSCRNLFNKTKLERLQKRKTNDTEQQPEVSKRTRSSPDC